MNLENSNELTCCKLNIYIYKRLPRPSEINNSAWKKDSPARRSFINLSWSIAFEKYASRKVTSPFRLCSNFSGWICIVAVMVLASSSRIDCAALLAAYKIISIVFDSVGRDNTIETPDASSGRSSISIDDKSCLIENCDSHVRQGREATTTTTGPQIILNTMEADIEMAREVYVVISLGSWVHSVLLRTSLLDKLALHTLKG